MGAGPDPRAPLPVAPGRGPGWAKVAEAVAAAMPPAEIDAIYLFRPIKREGREWGTAVVTRKSADGGGRLRVYTAKYMLVVRGKDRGQAKVEVKEVGLSPAEVLAQVMQATADRTGETEPPAEVGRGVWYEG
jgi:hypothetical protein